MRSEALLIGGRSGVGKTSAATALHELLVEADVQHAVIEGDGLGLAHPAPHLAFPEAELAERNLHLMWRNYRELGYHRLVYTNTLSVIHADRLAEAMADGPLVTAVLLRASDAATAGRLDRRAGGRASEADVAHSSGTAPRLDREIAESVHRVDTDHLTAREVAERLRVIVGW